MAMTQEHKAVVEAQFGPRAQAYVASAVHASGEDLDQLEALAKAASPRHALDLGCGGGHVAYRPFRCDSTFTRHSMSRCPALFLAAAG